MKALCSIKMVSDSSSVRPHVSALLLLDGFTWNLMMATFMKICRQVPRLI